MQGNANEFAHAVADKDVVEVERSKPLVLVVGGHDFPGLQYALCLAVALRPRQILDEVA